MSSFLKTLLDSSGSDTVWSPAGAGAGGGHPGWALLFHMTNASVLPVVGAPCMWLLGNMWAQCPWELNTCWNTSQGLGIPYPRFCWIVAEAISGQHGLMTNSGKVTITSQSNSVFGKQKARFVPSQVVWPSRKGAQRKGGPDSKYTYLSVFRLVGRSTVGFPSFP